MEKRKGFGYVLNGGYWHGEAADGSNLKWGTLCDWLGVPIWLSLVSPKLKAEQKLGKLLVNQVPAIWGRL